jgi:hypothetical protein
MPVKIPRQFCQKCIIQNAFSPNRMGVIWSQPFCDIAVTSLISLAPILYTQLCPHHSTSEKPALLFISLV